MKVIHGVKAALASALVIAGVSVAAAQDKGLENPRSAAFFSEMKDKKVVFVPLSMGFDLTEGWAARMKNQAARLGYSFEIRDPAWSTDAGTKAIQSLITEQPDLMVIHNPDIQSYARLLKQAQAAGIKVVQINLE
jgi:ribose transport system substrate-binding protein